MFLSLFDAPKNFFSLIMFEILVYQLTWKTKNHILRCDSDLLLRYSPRSHGSDIITWRYSNSIFRGNKKRQKKLYDSYHDDSHLRRIGTPSHFLVTYVNWNEKIYEKNVLGRIKFPYMFSCQSILLFVLFGISKYCIFILKFSLLFGYSNTPTLTCKNFHLKYFS